MHISRRHKKTVNLSIALAAFFCVLPMEVCRALPTDYTVESGDVSFDTSDPSALQITASDNAIINFSSFSIGANETVRFVQPFESATVLSRVNGMSSSDIFGSLYSNGRLMLVNPNGINFGAGANIQTHSLIASTLDIQNANYLAGQYIFEKQNGSITGVIQNDATIAAAEGGHVAMLAERIKNNGTIEARKGSVVLAAGTKSTISFDPAGLINIVVDEGVNNAVAADGALVDNKGTLKADGGKVAIHAKTVDQAFDALINNEGTVQASTLVERNGVIELVASGPISSTGTISGGEVTIHSLGESQFGTVIASEKLMLASYAQAAPVTYTQTPASTVQVGTLNIGTNVTLAAADTRYEISKDWLNDGSFQAAESIVLLTSLQDALVTGSNTFNNLSVIEPQKSVSFEAGSTQEITGVLTLQGQNGKLLTIRSSSDAIPASLNILGEYHIDFINLQNMTNILNHGPPAQVSHSNFTDTTGFSLLLAGPTMGPVYLFGENSFFNVEITSPDQEIYFEAGHTTTITGSFHVQGAPDQGPDEFFVKFRSTNTGSQYFINAQGLVNLDELNIQDANAINHLFILTGVNAGNNTNWLIDPTWDNGGGDGLWSTANNWSGNAVPTGADPVTFDNTSDANVNIDNVGSWSGGDFTIAAGYDGTITQNVDMTVGIFSQGSANSIFDGTDQALIMNGAFTLSDGTFRQTSGTVTAKHDWTKSGGTYDIATNTGGTLKFLYNTDRTITGSVTLNNVSFDNPSSGCCQSQNTIAGGTTLTVNGTLTFDNSGDQRFRLNTGTIEAKGDIVIADAGMYDGSATLLINGSGTQTFTGNATLGSGEFIKVNIDKGATTLNLSGTIRTTRDWTYTSGTVSAGSSTVVFAADNITITGSHTLNNVTFTNPSSGCCTYQLTIAGGTTLTVAGTLTFNNNGGDQAFSIHTGTLSAQGNVDVEAGGTFGGTGTFQFAGSNTQSFDLTGATAIFNMTTNVNKSGGQVNLLSAFTLDSGNNLTIQEGTFDINGQALSVSGGGTFTVETGGNFQLQGDETPTAPTLNSGSTVTYDATSGTRDIKDWTYHHLTINGAGGTFTMGADETLTGNVTITAGILSPGTRNITLAGNWSNSGTFTAGTGTVTFNGTSQSLTGSTTFNNFTKVEGANDSVDETLTFDHTATFTVAGTLTLDGRDADDRINLRSSSPGDQWSLNVTTAGTIDAVDVQDSDATPGIVLTAAAPSISSGNNTDWLFAMTIAGTLLQADESTPYTAAVRTIGFRINGGSHTSTTTSVVDGTFTSPTLTVADGDSIIVYIEGAAQDGNTITITNGAPLTGFSVIIDHVVVRSDRGATPITIADMNDYDRNDDSSDILFYVDIGSPNTLTVASLDELFIASGAIFTPGGNVTINDSDADINGTWNATGSETIYAGYGWDLTGGTFNAASGTVIFTSVSSGSSMTGNTTFNNLNFSGSNSTDFTVTAGTTLTVNGTLTLDGGRRLYGPGSISAKGNVVQEAGFVGVGLGTGGGDLVLTLNGAGTQTYTINGGAGPRVVLSNASATATVNGNAIFTSITLTNGVWNGGSSTVTVDEDFINNATFNPQSGTVKLTGDGSATYTDSITFNNLTFDSFQATRDFTLNSGVTYTVNGTLTLTTGRRIFGPGGFAAKGNVVFSAGFTGVGGTAGDAAWTLNGTSAQQFTGQAAVSPTSATVTIANSGADITLASATNFDALTISSGGSLSLNGNNLTVDGTFTNAGTLKLTGDETVTQPINDTGSTITYKATSGTRDIKSWSYYNLTIDGSGGTFTLPRSMGIGGTVTIANGTLDVTGSNYTILAANWAQTGGTFNAQSGTVVLVGATNSTFSATSSFNILRIEDPTESGLVGYWKMDEAGGLTVFDFSGNGNEGILTNGAGFQGNGSTAVDFTDPDAGSFDGSNDYVDLGTPSVLDNLTGDKLTLSAWVKFDRGTTSVSEMIFSKDGQYFIRKQGLGLRFSITTTVQTYFYTVAAPSTAFDNSSWFHIAGVYDGSAMTIYLNGTAQASPLSATGNLVASGQAATINNTGLPLQGDIDEVRVYNRALTSTEISNLAAGGNSAANTGTVTYTMGSDITAASALVYNGTLATATKTLHTTGNLDVVGGALSAASGDLNIDGNVSIADGTLTAPTAADDTSFLVAGNWSITGTGTFTPGTGRVIFDGAAAGKTITTTSSNADDFGDFKVTGAGDWTLQDALTATGTVTLNAGTLATGANTLTVGGLTLGGGTLTATTGTLDVNGNVTLTTGTLTAPNGERFTVSGNWSKAGGATFTHSSGVVTFDGTNQSFTGSTTFFGFKKVESTDNSTDSTLTFDNTATITIAGLWTLNGLDDNDRINLISDSSGNQWSLNASGTFALDFIDVRDSDASGGSTPTYTDALNHGNNLNWGFTDPYISGTAYASDETTSLITTSRTVAIRINGGAPTTVETNTADGTFEFIGLSGLNDGDTVTIYLNGETETGNVITITNGTADIIGIKLIDDHVVIRSDRGATALAIADMVDYDNDQNATDMLFDAEDAATDTLDVESAVELYIQSGGKFTPAGTVTVDTGGIDINGTWTATGSEAIADAGDWDATGGVFASASGTVTFAGSGHTIITGGTDADHDFHNIVINFSTPIAGFYIPAASVDDMVINGNLTLTQLRWAVETNVQLKGNLIINSTNVDPAIRNGELIFNGSTAQSITNAAGETDYIADIRIANTAATVTLNDPITIGAFRMNANTVFNANSKDMAVSGGNWTVDPTAVFTSGSNTITFNSVGTTSFSTGGADANHSFNHVVIDLDASTSSFFVTNGEDMLINGNLTLTEGRCAIETNVYLKGNLIIGSTNIDPSIRTGILVFSGTSLQTISNASGETDDIANFKVSNSTGVRLDHALVVDDMTIDSATIFDVNNKNFTALGTFTNNGTLKLTGDETVTTPTNNAGSTVEYTATSGSRAIKPWSYANLVINGAGGTFTMPAISLLQANSVYGGQGSSPLSLAFSSNNTAGSLIVIYYHDGSDIAVVGDPSISDTNGNTYYKAVGGIHSVYTNGWIYYAYNVKPGANTVTVTGGANTNDAGIHMAEFSGVFNGGNPLDQVASGTGSGTSYTTSTVTTLFAHELLFAGGGNELSPGGFSAGSGFTLSSQQPAHPAAAEYQITSTAGNYYGDLNGPNAVDWVATLATFRSGPEITGNLTVSAGTFDIGDKTAHVQGGLTVNGGTLDADSGVLDIDGNVSVSSGVLTAPTAANDTSFVVGGNWSITGTGTFTPGTGRVIFDGTAAGKTITTTSSNADDFGTVKFTGSGGVWTLQDDLSVDGDLIISASTLAAGSHTITLTGVNTDWNATGGIFDAGTGNVVFAGLGTMSLISGGTDADHDFNDLTFNLFFGNQIVEVITNEAMVSDDLTIVQAILEFDMAVHVKGDVSVTGTDFYGITGELILDGSGLQTLSDAIGAANEARAIGDVHIMNTSGAGVVLADAIRMSSLTMDANTRLDTDGNDMYIYTNWTVHPTATFLSGANTVYFDVAAPTISSGGTDASHDFNHVVFDAFANNQTFIVVNNDMVINGNFALTAGYLFLTEDIQLKGNFILGAGVELDVNSSNGGFVVFSGTGTQTVTNASGVAVQAADFKISNTSAEVQLSDNITLNNITIDANAIFDIDDNNLTVSGTFTNNGTLQLDGDQTVSTPTNNAGSTVEYTATSGTRDIKNWTYNSLHINGAGGTFTMSASEVLGGTLTVSAGTLSMGTRNIDAAGVTLIDGTISGSTGILTSTTAYDVRSGSISAIVAGSAGMTKTTAATVTLSGTNTLTGGLTIKAGTVYGNNNANAFGANSNVITLGDSGGSADATLMSYGALTWANPIIVASGSSGTLTMTSNNFSDSDIYTGAVTLNNDLRILVSGGGITFNGDVDGPGTITNTGPGPGATSFNGVIGSSVAGVIQDSATSTLGLSGNNTFTGGLTIKAGTVFGGGGSANNFGADSNVITIGDTGGSANATLVSSTGATHVNPIIVAAGSSGILTISSPNFGSDETIGSAIVLNNNLTVAQTNGINGASLIFTGGITGTGNLTISNTSAGGVTFSTTSLNHTGTITNSGSGSGATTISAVIGPNVTGVTQNSATSQLTLSTVNTYTGTLTATAGTLNITGTVTPSALTVNGGTLTATTGTLDVNGNVNISSGTLTAPNGERFTVSGNWSKAGAATFTHSSGTVTFDGTNQSLTGSTTFFGLKKVESTDNSTDSTLTFDNTATFTIAGLFTLDGLDADDRINLRSDLTGTQWSLNASGTFALDFIDVKDSDASGGSTPTYTNALNSGNNTNWFTSQPYASGTVYQTDETTPITGSTRTITARINGGSAISVTTNSGDGTFEFTNLVGATDGSTITFYIDGAAEDGNTITITNGSSDITGLAVIDDHVVIRSDRGATAITIADLIDYDNDQNAADMLFDAEDAATDTLSVENNNELFITSGDFFTPGGNVTAGTGGIDINGTWTATGTETLSNGGSWDFTGGTYSPANSAVTWDANNGSGVTLTGNATFYDLTIGSGVWVMVLSDDIIVQNDLVIQKTGNAIVVDTGETHTISVAGDVTNTGTSGVYSVGITIVMNGTSTQTVTSSGGTAVNLGSLQVANTSASVLLGSGVNFHDVIIDPSATLDVTSNNYDILFQRHWTNNGTFSAHQAEVIWNRVDHSELMTGANTFYDLTVQSSYSATIGDDVIVQNDFTFTGDSNGFGSEGVETHTISVGGDFTHSGNANFEPDLTVVMNGSTVQTVTVSGSGKPGDLTIANTSAEVQLGSNLSVLDDITVNANAIFDLAGFAVTGNGIETLFTNNGTLQLTGDQTFTNATPVNNAGSTVEYTATSGTRNIKDWSYHHLTVNGAGGTFTMGADETLGGNLTVQAGTFTIAAARNIDVNGNVSVSGGTLNAPDVADDTSFLVAGSWAITGTGTFNPGTDGRVIFDGTASGKTITTTSSNADDFGNVKFPGVGGVWTMQDDLTVDDITISGGTLAAGAFNLTVNGENWNATGGIFDSGTGTVTFTGNNIPGTVTIVSGGTDADHDFNDVSFINTISVLGTITVSGNDMVINDDLAWDEGGLALTTNIQLKGDLAITSTTVDTTSGAGELIFNGAGLQVITNAPGETAPLANFRITNSSVQGVRLDHAISVRNFIMDANARFDANSMNILVDGTAWTVDPAATFISGSNTITFNGGVSGTLTMTSGGTDAAHDFNNISLINTVGVLSGLTVLTNDMVINGDLTLDEGSLNLTANIQLKGNLFITSTNVSAESGSGDLIFNGAATQTITNAVGEADAIAEVRVSNTSAEVQLSDAITFTDLVIDADTILDIDDNNLTVNGTFTNNGTLQLDGDQTVSTPTNNAGSTVEYTATAGTRAIKDWTYQSLKLNGAGGTFTMGAGETLGENLTVTAGTFDVNDQTLAINGNTVLSGGTMKTGTNTVTFGNAGADSVTISGTAVLEIESDNTATDIVINAGTWTNTAGTITYNAGTAISTALLSALSPYFNLTVNSSGSTYALDGAITVNGTIDLINGNRITGTAGTPINAKGDIILEATFTGTAGNAGTALWNVNGSSAQIITGRSDLGLSSGGVVIANTSGGVSLASDTDFTNLTVTTGTLTTGAYVLQITNNLVVNGGTLNASSGTLDVNGNVTLTTGTLTAPNGERFTVGGNWSKAAAATFTHSSGTVTFDGTNQSLTGSTTFFGLKKVESTDNSTDSTLTFEAGSTTTVNGLLTLDGLDANDRINLVSSDPGTPTQWLLHANGTFAIDYVDVTDSDASGGTTISHTNTVDSGNNLNWGFYTIAGIAYAADESTPLTGSARNIALRVNGGAPYTTTSSAADGTFSFGTVTASAGDTLTIYFYGASDSTAGAEVGNVVTVTDGATSVSGIKLIKDHVVLRSDNGATPLTIAKMAAYDNDQNAANLLFDAEDAATDTLVVETGNELYIDTGAFFTPGGNVTTAFVQGGSRSDIDINGTWTATGTETITDGGGWDATGGTFIAASGTVIFNNSGNATSPAITGSTSFNNVTFNDGGYGMSWTIGAGTTMTVNGTLNIAFMWALNGPGVVSAKGDVVQDYSAGGNTTLTLDGVGVQTYTINGGGAPNVVLNNAQATINVTGVIGNDSFRSLTITAGTVNAGSSTTTIAGGNFTNNGTFNAQNSTVIFLMGGTSPLTLTGNTTFNHLTFDGNGYGFSEWIIANGTTLTVNGNVSFLALGAQLNGPGAMIVKGDVTVGGTDTGSAGNADWTFSGTSEQIFTGRSDLYLTTGTMTIANISSLVRLGANSQLATTVVINANATLKANGYDLAVGTTFTNNGTFILQGNETVSTPTNNSGSTVEYTAAAGSRDIYDWTYHSLHINGAGTFTMSASEVLGGDLTVSAGTFTIGAQDLEVNGNVSVTAGTLTAPTASDDTSFLVAGNWSVTGTGTFTPGTGRVIFDGTAAGKTITTTSSNPDDFNDVKFTGAGGVWTLQDDLLINGNLTIAGGTLNGGSANLYLIGDWTLSSGGFSAGSGTVTFDHREPGNTAHAITGSATFNDLTFDPQGYGVTWTIAAGTTLTVNDVLTLTANGSINGPGTISAKGDVIQAGAPVSFQGGSTTLTLNGAGVQTYTVNGGIAPNVVLNNSQATINVNADNRFTSLVITDGVFNGSSFVTRIDGDLTNNGTFNAQTGTIWFGYIPGGTITGDTTFNNVIVDDGGYNIVRAIASGTTLTVNGTLYLTQAARLDGPGTISAKGDVVQAAGFTAGGVFPTTITLNGAGAQAYTINGGIGPNIVLNNSQATATMNAAATFASLAIDQGVFNLKGSDLTVNGAFTNSATLQLTGDNASVSTPTNNAGSTVEYTATSSTRNIKNWTYHHLTFNGSGGTFTMGASEVLGGNLTVSAGTFTVGAQDIDVNGNVSVSGGTLNAPTAADDTSFLVAGNWSITGTGTFNPSTGRVIFDGTAAGKTITTTSSNADDFGTVKFTGSGGVWTLQDDLTTGDLTISGGATVACGSYTLTILGSSYNATGGIFDAGTGTVIFGSNVAVNNTTVVTGGTDADHDFNNVVMNLYNPTDYTLALTTDDMLVNGNFTMTQGRFGPTTNMQLKGNLIVSGANVYSMNGSGSLVFAGSGLQTISNSSGNPYSLANFRISNTSAQGVLLNDAVSIGDFIMDANAKFDANGKDIMTYAHFWTVAPTATFTSGANTVTFRANPSFGAIVVTTGGTDAAHDYNNVVLNFPDPTIYSLDVETNDMVINGNLTFTSGTLSLSANIQLKGNVVIGSLGSGSVNAGDLIFNGSGLQTITNAALDTDILTDIRISNTSAQGVRLDHALAIGSFVMDANTKFDANGKDIAVRGNINGGAVWDVAASATFISGANTVTFGKNGSTIATQISTGGTDANHDFNNVVMNLFSDIYTFELVNYDIVVNGNFTMTEGAWNATTNMQLKGNLIISGANIGPFQGAGDIIFNGSSQQTVSNAAGETDAIADMQFSNAAGVKLNDAVIVHNATINSGDILNLNNKNFTATGAFINNGTLQLTGDETVTQLTNNTGSTVEYTATSGTRNINDWTYESLKINGSGGTFTMGADEVLGGDLTITAGTLSAGTRNITLAGDWSNTGNFNAGTGTVTFSGTAQTISGNTTFNDLTKITGAVDTLTFAAGSTQTVTGTLTLEGAALNLLTLASGSPGTMWNIDPQGARSVNFVDVSWSYNTDALPIFPTNSNDGGNTLNWFTLYTPPAPPPAASGPDPSDMAAIFYQTQFWTMPSFVFIATPSGAVMAAPAPGPAPAPRFAGVHGVPYMPGRVTPAMFIGASGQSVMPLPLTSLFEGVTGSAFLSSDGFDDVQGESKI